MTIDTSGNKVRMVSYEDSDVPELLRALLDAEGYDLEALKEQADVDDFESLRAELVWREVESFLYRIRRSSAA